MVQAVQQAPGKENAGASPDCQTMTTVPKAKKRPSARLQLHVSASAGLCGRSTRRKANK